MKYLLVNIKQVNDDRKKNSRYQELAILRLKCLHKTFGPGSTLGILLNFSANNPPLRLAEKSSHQLFTVLYCIRLTKQ